MEVISVSSREFNRQSSKIRELSKTKPVVITVRGMADSVLMDYKLYAEHFGRLEHKKNILEMLSDPGCVGAGDVDVDFDRRKDLPRNLDLD